MTKRFLSLFLALLMVFSLTIPAFAEEEQETLTDEEVQELIDSGEAFQFEGTPDTGETSEAGETPEVEVTPDTEEVPETDEAPQEDVPDTEETPDVSDAEETPGADVPVADVPAVEEASADDEYGIMPLAAEPSGNCGSQVNWRLTDSNTKLIIAGSGAMDGFDLDAAPWKDYISSITTLEIEDNVTSIGAYAFYNCSNLANVTIGKGVTSIGQYAFGRCTALTAVTIPSNVRTIGDNAFNKCSQLAAITIPASVTSIGEYAFYDCSALATVTINNGVTSIGSYAFGFCQALKSVSIPASVTTLGSYVFYNCSGLTQATIGKGVTDMGAGLFWNCSALTKVTITEGVTSLGMRTFYGCIKLTKIDIPASVTSLDRGMFEECKALTAVNVADDNKNYSSDGGILLNKDKTTVLFCPMGKTGKYEIPSTVTTVSDNAFLNTSLTEITVPASVRTIEVDAFSSDNLKKITIQYPDCQIADSERTLGNPATTVVCGWDGSTAESYADIYEYKFESLGDPSKLDPPKLIEAKSYANGVNITWEAVNGAVRYRVFYKTGTSGWMQLGETTSTSYLWTGAVAGSTYTFTVRCITADSKTYTSGYDEAGVTVTHYPCAAPKITAVSTLSTSAGVKITWDAVKGAVKYRVFYKIGDGAWTKIADTAATSYTWTGAKGGTTYTFTVRCINSDATAYTSNYDTVGKTLTYLTAPVISSLSCVADGINITWNKVAGAVNYRVFYKTSNGWQQIADTTATSYVWTGAKNNTNYTFTVRCMSADSKAYASAYDTTGKSITYLTAPVVSSLTNTLEGVKITWDKVTGAAKYRVFYKTGNGAWTKITDTTATSYTWTKPKSGTTYVFTVRCIDSAGSAYTSGYDGVGKSITYLSAPVISSLSGAANGMNITWNKVAGAEKYRVFYKTSSGWEQLADTTATSYVWTGAKNNTKYTFTVRCISSDGSAYTSGFDGAGKSATYLAAPAVSSLTNTLEGVKITWNKVAGAVKYRVFYKTGNGAWTKIADTAATSYTWTKPKSGTTYAFTVRCINSDATAYTSGYDGVGKSITYLSSPVISSLSNVLGGVKITWNKVAGAEKYRVFYKASSGWVQLADTDATSYTWDGARNNTNYTFTVRCVNSDGSAFTSGFNGAGKSITYLSAPVLSSVTNTSNGVKITWDKVNGAAKYRIFFKTNTGWQKIADTTATSYTWTNPAKNTYYTFTVRCINSAGTAYTSGFDGTGQGIQTQ